MPVLADLQTIKIPGTTYNLTTWLLLLYLFLCFSANRQCPISRSPLTYLFPHLTLKFVSPFNILSGTKADQIRRGLELHNSNALLPLTGWILSVLYSSSSSSALLRDWLECSSWEAGWTPTCSWTALTTRAGFCESKLREKCTAGEDISFQILSSNAWLDAVNISPSR